MHDCQVKLSLTFLIRRSYKKKLQKCSMKVRVDTYGSSNPCSSIFKMAKTSFHRRNWMDIFSTKTNNENGL